MRLIDADRLEKELRSLECSFRGGNGMISGGLALAISTLNAQPDAVVRCKDCRWGKEVCGNIECFADINVPPEYHGYEWFCPNGERRTDD